MAFEHGVPGVSRVHTIIFIGGLGDGLLTVPYTTSLAKILPESWSLVEVLLGSSYAGWGVSSLDSDVKELSTCVAYFRSLRPRGRIVLLGHSTGCQDVLHYLISADNPPGIDGGILQAPVSDREFMDFFLSPSILDGCVNMAREYIEDGRGDDVLPIKMTGNLFQTPISANRWLSLASPGPDHAGQDDYFSSDFDIERMRRTFGKAGSTRTRLSLLCGGSDEYVPPSVDKHALIGKWLTHIKDGGGVIDDDAGIINGASHSLGEGGEPTEDLQRRVLGFIDRLEKIAS